MRDPLEILLRVLITIMVILVAWLMFFLSREWNHMSDHCYSMHQAITASCEPVRVQ